MRKEIKNKEENNVRQWEDWGFDYLKYDWTPCDPPTAHKMKQALLASRRAFGFCVTTTSNHFYGNYWSTHCNSWRDNRDSLDEWGNIVARMQTVDTWKPYVKPGHFYDLDMLEVGPVVWNKGVSRLSENEQLFAYTMRAFFLSPIQISCRLDKLTEFEQDMLCNKEMLRISQDSLCDYPTLISANEAQTVKLYRRDLEHGDAAVCVFNMTEDAVTSSIPLETPAVVMDVWSGQQMACTRTLRATTQSHSLRVFRVLKGESYVASNTCN